MRNGAWIACRKTAQRMHPGPSLGRSRSLSHSAGGLRPGCDAWPKGIPSPLAGIIGRTERAECAERMVEAERTADFQFRAVWRECREGLAPSCRDQSRAVHLAPLFFWALQPCCAALKVS